MCAWFKATKKPLEVNVIKWDGKKSTFNTIRALEGCAGVFFNRYTGDLIVPTSEGDMICTVGNYLIVGLVGEVYPISEEAFKAGYTCASDSLRSDHE